MSSEKKSVGFIGAEEDLASKKIMASKADNFFSILDEAKVIEDFPALMANLSLGDSSGQSAGSSGRTPTSSSSDSDSPIFGFSPRKHDFGLRPSSSTWSMSSEQSLSPGRHKNYDQISSERFTSWGKFIELPPGKERNIQIDPQRYFLSSNNFTSENSSSKKSPQPSPTLSPKKLNEDSFLLEEINGKQCLDELLIYPMTPCQKVQEAAVFFIETPPGNHLPEGCAVQVTHPHGYMLNLKASPDYLHPDRYVCSFIPSETGKFTISVVFTSSKSSPICGKPHEFFVSRNYEGTSRDPVSNLSVVKLGFGRDSNLLSKGWGIGIHRPTNTIYLADRESHNIVMLDQAGKVVKRFGREGHGRGQLYRPTGIAVDAKNKRVYVTDKDNHRICVFTLQGNYISHFGRKGHHNGEFNYPWGIAVSPDGDLVAVSDSRNHRIQLFDGHGNFIRKYSVFENNPFEYKTEFNYPRGICFSMDGSKLYVADFNIHVVFVLNVEFTTKRMLTAPGSLLRPQGLTLDEAGNILIADSKNNCIRVVSPCGSQVCIIDGTGIDGFDMPMDVAVLNGGRVAVTDAERRFRIF